MLAAATELTPFSAEIWMAGYGLTQSNNGMVGHLRKAQSFLSFEDTTGRELHFDSLTEKNVCDGDSGGPAYFAEPTTQQPVLVGVSSRYFGTCESGRAIFTDIRRYATWISENFNP